MTAMVVATALAVGVGVPLSPELRGSVRDALVATIQLLDPERQPGEPRYGSGDDQHAHVHQAMGILRKGWDKLKLGPGRRGPPLSPAEQAFRARQAELVRRANEIREEIVVLRQLQERDRLAMAAARNLREWGRLRRDIEYRGYRIDSLEGDHFRVIDELARLVPGP